MCICEKEVFLVSFFKKTTTCLYPYAVHGHKRIMFGVLAAHVAAESSSSLKVKQFGITESLLRTAPGRDEAKISSSPASMH